MSTHNAINATPDAADQPTGPEARNSSSQNSHKKPSQGQNFRNPEYLEDTQDGTTFPLFRTFSDSETASFDQLTGRRLFDDWKHHNHKSAFPLQPNQLNGSIDLPKLSPETVTRTAEPSRTGLTLSSLLGRLISDKSRNDSQTTLRPCPSSGSGSSRSLSVSEGVPSPRARSTGPPQDSLHVSRRRDSRLSLSRHHRYNPLEHKQTPRPTDIGLKHAQLPGVADEYIPGLDFAALVKDLPVFDDRSAENARNRTNSASAVPVQPRRDSSARVDALFVPAAAGTTDGPSRATAGVPPQLYANRHGIPSRSHSLNLGSPHGTRQAQKQPEGIPPSPGEATGSTVPSLRRRNGSRASNSSLAAELIQEQIQQGNLPENFASLPFSVRRKLLAGVQASFSEAASARGSPAASPFASAARFADSYGQRVALSRVNSRLVTNVFRAASGSNQSPVSVGTNPASGRGSLFDLSVSPASRFLAQLSRPVSAPDDEGQIIDGKYTIGTTIGCGAYGTVKEAHHTTAEGVKMTCAVKIIRMPMASRGSSLAASRRQSLSYTDGRRGSQQSDSQNGSQSGSGSAGSGIDGEEDEVDGETNEEKKVRELRLQIRLEVEIWKTLDHPHILKLLSYTETEFGLFCITERIYGGSVYDRVKAHRNEGLQSATAKEYFRQLAEALRYLHVEQRVVHRDVKMENCLLKEQDTEHGKEWTLLLCDFGMAEYLPEQVCMESPMARDIPVNKRTAAVGTGQQKFWIGTEAGSSDVQRRNPYGPSTTSANLFSPYSQTNNIGSLPYAAPELLEAGVAILHPAVDMWALGVFLYAILVGELPFHHGYEPRLKSIIIKGQFPEEKVKQRGMERWPADVSTALELLHGCMCKDINKRWDIHKVLKSSWVTS